MEEKLRLQDEDWKLLFPDQEYTLGTQKLQIRPLDLIQLSLLKEKMEEIAPKLVAKGITRETYASTENILYITGLAVDTVPDIISEVSGVHEEDIKRLPLTILGDLVKVIISMNLEAKEGLEKNFKALGAELEMMVFGESETRSTNSLQQGTGGKISKDTPKAR